ncbi:prophenin-2-like isoform X2 [Dreissena polymorpha]|uniref:prophenin-2-like isoform X2 n=1 Tax=Dreissena polymorpha TaxID=45954 RepID=UPI002263B073|nr:prophenin-2-like isoform X2 [Dreissena polymorpha]
MKLLLLGLFAAMLVWGPQTRAQKDDLTNDEVLEAEARANKPSVGAAENKFCDGECAEFEGDDLDQCIEACEQDSSKQLEGVDDGDDKGSQRRKRGWIRIRLPRIPLPRIPLPRIPLPRIPLPRIPLPRIPLPRIPLPRIPLPRIPIGKKKRSVEVPME